MANIVNEKIETNFNDFIEDLKKLISIPSVYSEDESTYPFGEDIDRALKEMLFIAKKLGFETFYDPEGYYGYAQYGQGEEMIGILGHLDVVPAGDPKKWNTPAFEPAIIDGSIFGRGVQDDKGPMLTAMYALKAVMDSGISVGKKVRFIYGTDEERLWKCIGQYNKKEQIPDYGFTPDANFPLIYAEKGLLQVDLKAANESGITLFGGEAYNSVPSGITYETQKSEAIARQLEDLGFEYKLSGDSITVSGKSVHAKDAEQGTNAICRLLMAMDAADLKSKCSTFITQNINEDALAKNIFGECTDEMSGALKFNIGKISMDENHEILNIDIRIPVSVEKEFVLEKLTSAAHNHGFELSENDYLRSIYTPLDSPIVKALMESYQEVTGDLDSLPISSGGATYARAMDNCVAFGPAFPYTKETEHQPNEFVKLEEVKLAMEVYSNAIIKLLKL
ncbi:MAG: Sapep family Mn(2+)-dependent dipeptidase [Proteocatella sp.]